MRLPVWIPNWQKFNSTLCVYRTTIFPCWIFKKKDEIWKKKRFTDCRPLCKFVCVINISHVDKVLAAEFAWWLIRALLFLEQGPKSLLLSSSLFFSRFTLNLIVHAMKFLPQKTWYQKWKSWKFLIRGPKSSLSSVSEFRIRSPRNMYVLKELFLAFQINWHKWTNISLF